MNGKVIADDFWIATDDATAFPNHLTTVELKPIGTEPDPGYMNICHEFEGFEAFIAQKKDYEGWLNLKINCSDETHHEKSPILKRTIFSICVLAITISPATVHAQLSGQPRIFVKAEPSFSVALAAAMNNKRDPATIVLDEKTADFVLQAASVNAKEESGLSKLARCAFAYCIGIEGTSTVSVELVRVSDSAVVWAYQVRKASGGPTGIQSLSEAIAKHLKNDYLIKQPFERMPSVAPTVATAPVPAPVSAPLQ